MTPFYITYDIKDNCIWGIDKDSPESSLDDARHSLSIAKDRNGNSYTVEKFITVPATIELWRDLEGKGWQDQKWEIINGVANLKKKKVKL